MLITVGNITRFIQSIYVWHLRILFTHLSIRPEGSVRQLLTQYIARRLNDDGESVHIMYTKKRTYARIYSNVDTMLVLLVHINR